MELSKIAMLNWIANVGILSRRKIIDTNLMLNNNIDKHKDDSQLFFDFIFWRQKCNALLLWNILPSQKLIQTDLAIF